MYDSKNYKDTANKTGDALSKMIGVPSHYRLSKRFAWCSLRLPAQSTSMLTNWEPVGLLKLWMYPLFRRSIQSLSGFQDTNCSVVSPPLWWMRKPSTICKENAAGDHEIPTHVMMVVRNAKERAVYDSIKDAFKKMGINVYMADRTAPVTATLPMSMWVYKLFSRPDPNVGSE